MGIVSLRHEFQFTQIDVEFMNKQFHRNLGITDDYGATMATLNYSGMLIANPALEQDEDAYEEVDELDEQGNRRKNSNIEFRPFNEWKNVKPWNFQLKNGESVECLSMGTGWCCAYTNFNNIRVFSHTGIQRHVLSQGMPVVTMAGYEGLLVIVYQTSPGLYGSQTMRMKVVNMSTRDYRVLIDTEMSLSRNANLLWLSFSEEGQVYSYDTEGVMRAFSFMSQ